MLAVNGVTAQSGRWVHAMPALAHSSALPRAMFATASVLNCVLNNIGLVIS
jgi:hypothetical protein